MKNANKYLAEAIGTFVLIFAGCGAMMTNELTGALTHPGVAITWGLAVMTMIYSFGDISGAHLNPAVTLGFWLARKLPGREVAPYILSQLLGAIAASATLLVLFGNLRSLGASLFIGSPQQAFGLETILSAALMLVILNVSTGPKETGTLAGIAIGGTVALESMFAGPICNASMNPARSLGPAIVSGNMMGLWVYLIAPFLGSAIAVLIWKLVRVSGRSATES